MGQPRTPRADAQPAQLDADTALGLLRTMWRIRCEGDSEKYRDPIAEEEWQRCDPLARLRAHAIANDWLDEQAAGVLEQEARAEVEQAVRYARASRFPNSGVAAELVYAEGEAL